MSKVEDQMEDFMVLFQGVKEAYSSKTDLACELRLRKPSAILLDENCIVSIFPVGWSTILNSICSAEFSSFTTEKDGVYSFMFKKEELPQPSHEEFYQFCLYDKKTKNVHGASCPFQICDGGSLADTYFDVHEAMQQSKMRSDAFWLDDEGKSLVDQTEINDTVFVHNKTSSSEDSLLSYCNENTQLKEQIKCCNETMSDLHKQIETEKLLAMQIKINEENLSQEVEKLQGKDFANTTKNKELEETVVELSLKISNMGLMHKEKEENNLQNFQTNLSEKQNLLELVQEENAQLKTILEKETISRDEFQMLESNFGQKLQELNGQLESKTEMHNAERAQHENEKNEMQQNLELKNEELLQLTTKLAEEKELSKYYEEECRSLEINLNNSKDELHVMSLNYETLSKQHSEAEAFLQEFTQNEVALKMEIQTLTASMGKQQAEMDTVSENVVRGPIYALKIANNHLQKLLMQARNEQYRYQKLYEETCKKTEETEKIPLKDDEKQIRDLKLRLEMGKDVFEKKYQECAKLQKELETTKRQLEKKPTEEENSSNELKEAQAEIERLNQQLNASKQSEQKLKQQIENSAQHVRSVLQNKNVRIPQPQSSNEYRQQTAEAQRSSSAAPVSLRPSAAGQLPRPLFPYVTSPSENSVVHMPPGWAANSEPSPMVMREQTHLYQQQSPTLLGRGSLQPRPVKCPVCGLQFPGDVNEDHLSEHVNRHFDS